VCCGALQLFNLLALLALLVSVFIAPVAMGETDEFGRKLSQYGGRKLSQYGGRRLSQYGGRRLSQYGGRKLSQYGGRRLSQYGA